MPRSAATNAYRGERPGGEALTVLYEHLVRPVLFRLGSGDAEAAHEWTLRRVAALGRRPLVADRLARYFAPGGQRLARTVFGLRFPTPVGLAAGMDKDGRAVAAWPALGFGFLELGTVTWHAQPGNPRPRLYRLPASGAVINRMGFNNHGAAALAERLAQVGPVPVPVGISLGKSKVTPVDDAVSDYLASLRVLYAHGDYFAVNVSSPNTPGLRSLQDAGRLSELLAALRAEVDTLAAGAPPKPLLVKIAPDLTDPAVGEVLDVCVQHGVAGVIATNTTLARDGVAASDAATATETGGLSGVPLAARALDVVRLVRKEAGDQLPVIGVGGVTDADAALRMFDAGASLVQVYTGLVYRGPGLLRRINRAVARQPH